MIQIGGIVTSRNAIPQPDVEERCNSEIAHEIASEVIGGQGKRKIIAKDR